MRQPRGSMVPDGEYATLTFRRVYPHRIDHVWEAISTPEGLRGWLMVTEATIEGRAGGRIEMKSGPARFHSSGRILAWDPPKLLEYEWNVAPVPEMPRGERAVFRYELAEDGDSTRLLVVYRQISMATARGFLPGLHAFLDRLEAQLGGGTMPAFEKRFGELLADYPEWSHAADPGQ
jgi:uncharacterized protein YndB with AHSA1/START domain